MNIDEIIKELNQNNIIKTKPRNYKKLTGGTSSELYLLCINEETNYVVKSNESQILKVESDFLKCYKELKFIPDLFFVEQSYLYIVYSYISGSSNNGGITKRTMLKALVENVINHYKTFPTDHAGFGYTDDLKTTWADFFLHELIEANNVLKQHVAIEEYHFVLNVLEELKNQESERRPMLLHGDCGVHNFIFNKRQLVGVIDPTPIIGYPLYDVIYAFCSSPDDLSKETLDLAVSYLTNKGERYPSILYKEVMIGLYLRLAACIKHHPCDFEKYLKAWFYWKKVIL
ncbi:phosphotransferase [Metabacillus litoralis]|uniref:Phosphotransferase n=1 Tax=Metabacillus litoralis TaxID=152268 RepID=A0A5C6W666_9BACI|nr:phosphotransferase [Metabacillus litoralis]TXC92823.1 phosphotransferase [Metabacillus litoralis]